MRTLFFFLLLCGLLIGSRYWYVCKIKNLCSEEQIEEIRPKTLSLREGNTIILDNYDQFEFEPNQVTPTLNNNNNQFLDRIAEHLMDNPDKNLTITGYFRENEKGIRLGIYDNLGIARAAKIREALVARGIEEKRITLDYNAIKGNDLLQPLRFELYGIPGEFEAGEGRLSKMEFRFFNMTFTDANFAFDSDKFTPQEAMRFYADSVKTYLEANPDKTLTIIGHTDFYGTDKYNEDLGLRRAKSAQKYFEDLGLTSKINVESKGEKEPVAPNTSDENRQKNRRVNFIIE